jgi:hypothetical protein
LQDGLCDDLSELLNEPRLGRLELRDLGLESFDLGSGQTLLLGAFCGDALPLLGLGAFASFPELPGGLQGARFLLLQPGSRGLRLVGAEQGGDVGAQAPVGEAADGMNAGAQGAGQGHDPRVAEPQGRGPPAVLDGWPRDPLKGWARKDTTLADTESVDHPAVHVTPAGEQFVQVLQAAGHPEIARVVDDGFGPETPDPA